MKLNNLTNKLQNYKKKFIYNIYKKMVKTIIRTLTRNELFNGKHVGRDR